jgi:DUF1680 family protein
MTSTTPTTRPVSTPLPLNAVTINDAFWSPRIEIVRDHTIPFQYTQLDTVGHLKALQHATDAPTPHIFWDSDIAKWIEAASYSLVSHPDPELESRLDEVIGLLADAQQDDGYLNTYFTLVAPDERWTDLRDAHELYCAGHLIEAGVAHHVATGKTNLLDVVRKYADYIGEVFGRGAGQLRGYDGHEEIELALVKLARVTGERRYLDLATYFVDERGQEPYFFDLEAERRGTPGWFAREFGGGNHPGRTREYLQAHAPVREQKEAVGHSVRAMYLYSAMADLARENEDPTLLEACRTLWEHLTTRRMYVTGGIGSSATNEGFTTDFDLPDETAYAETCAAIGVMMWAQRMLQIDRDRRYGDVLERALYNGVLSGMSSEGTCFFYDNPLASRGGIERHEWFHVACCPPNLARLLSSLGSYAFATTQDELLVHLFIAGTARFPVADGEAVVTVDTSYPWAGRVQLRVDETPDAPFTLSIRIPEWSPNPGVTVNGETLDLTAGHSAVIGEDGYLTIRRDWAVGDEVVVELALDTRQLRADPRVVAEAGRSAVTRGPLVYVLEEADNGAELHLVGLPVGAEFSETQVADVPDTVAITAPGRRISIPGEGLYRAQSPVLTEASLTFVPYYAWANRGAGEMRLWVLDMFA